MFLLTSSFYSPFFVLFQLFVLSLGLDGVAAFKSGQYELWPVGTKIWNLHPEERTSRGFLLLTALIPGPGKPKKFGPHLKSIILEIKEALQGKTLFP